MRRLASELARAATPEAVGEILAQDLGRRIGFGSYSFGSFDPHLAAPHLAAHSNEFPDAHMRSALPDMLFAVERDFGGLSASPALTSFDPQELYGQKKVEASEVFQRFWRPLRIHRQLVVVMRPSPASVAFLCVTRSKNEPGFARRDGRTLESAASIAQRSLRSFGSRCDDLSQVVEALAHQLPTPAFLFREDGTLVWLNDEGALRAEVESLRVGSSTLVRSSVLQRVGEVVRVAVGDPTLDPQDLLRSVGVLRPSEHAVLRRFQGAGSPLVLVALPIAGTSRASRVIPDLSAAQLRVAELAAAGYSLLNVAAHLGVTEATVRTHLRRAYARLGVHNRAELARAIPAPGELHPVAAPGPKGSRKQ